MSVIALLALDGLVMCVSDFEYFVPSISLVRAQLTAWLSVIVLQRPLTSVAFASCVVSYRELGSLLCFNCRLNLTCCDCVQDD